MQEVKNNGIDDDCNPETPDKGVYMPRQALFVDLTYDDTPSAGDTSSVKVSVTNYDAVALEDVRIVVSVGQERASSLVYRLAPGQTAVRQFEIEMPEYKGFDQLRIGVSNQIHKRVIYREILVQ
jgi:hypothetical protein